MSTDGGIAWRRAAGEFFIIVIGVLTALAIEGMVSWAGDRGVEREYLGALRSDLAADTLLLTRLIRADERLDGDVTRLLDVVQGRVPSENLPPVAMTLLQITGDRRIPFRNATYEDLVSTGNLRLVRDQELRSEIIRYYEQAEVIPVALDRSHDRFVAVRNQVAALIPVSTVRDLYEGQGPSVFAEEALLALSRESEAVASALETFLREKVSRVGILQGQKDRAVRLLEELAP